MRVLRWILPLLVLTACAKEGAPDSNGAQAGAGDAIGFDVVLVAPDSITKAAGEIVDGDALKLTAGFGVFASYTGKHLYEESDVTPDFMYNQEVTWAGLASAWVYNPVKYWPNQEGEYISFFAYAPYEPNPDTDKCIAGLSPIDEPGDPWILYKLAPDVAHQVDLMYGVNAATGKSWLDRQKPTGAHRGDPLSMRFEHALACVGDAIKLKASSALRTALSAGKARITVDRVNITYTNLTAKARLVLNTEGGPNWKPVVSGEYTTSRSVTVSPGLIISDGSTTTLSIGDGLFYIPMTVPGGQPQKAVVTVEYTVELIGSGPNGRAGETQSCTAKAAFNLSETVGSTQNIEITLAEDLLAVGLEQMRNVPLTIEAIADATVSFDNKAPGKVQYTLNGEDWVDMTSGIVTNIPLTAGSTVSFRGTNTQYATSEWMYSHIDFSAPCYVYGNVLSLVYAPAGYANATTLPVGDYTFAKLFYGNTNLRSHSTKVLRLPATTLRDNCYNNMFAGCTGITYTPRLEAPTLTEGCYKEMFSGCSALASITCLATDISATDCTLNWLDGVAADGVFVRASSMSGWTVGTSGRPIGWYDAEE